MAVPEALAVTILHNDVDITSLCPYEKMDLDDSLNDVSRFSLLIQNPSVTPEKGDTIFVYAHNLDGQDTLFSGLIIKSEEIRRGVVSDWRCEVADNKIRLQKSNVPTKQYTGIDTAILEELLADAYPDLSSVYDFSFANSVSDISQLLQANEDSLLDALKALRDKTGAKMSMTRPPGRYLLDFDGGGNISSGVGTYATMRRRTWDSFVGDSAGSIVTTDAIIANDGADGTDCYKWAGTEFKSNDVVAIVIACGSEVYVQNVTFDLYFNLAGRNLLVKVPYFSGSSNFEFTINNSEAGQWLDIDCDARGVVFPTPTGAGEIFVLAFLPVTTVAASAWEIKVDNIRVTLKTRNMKDELEWNNDYEDAPFDLDVANSDEYAKDIKFSKGAYNDFNAVIVTGGKQLQAFNEIFSSDGVSRIIALPAPIISRTVTINAGNDTSPSWQNLNEGIWGVDTLGGGIDYLYDPNKHWLYFAVANTPPNLNSSIQVNGQIEVPFRLLVPGTESDTEPIFAKTIQNDDISSIEEATAIGTNALNKRRASRRMEFTTLFPLLKVGQKMTVVDNSRPVPLNETIVINRIQIQWLGSSGHALFHVYCGEEEMADMDTQMAATDKKASKKSKLLSAGTITIDPLIDEDGIPFVDELDEDNLEDD